MELGPPMIAHAGKDDKWIPSDDGFVRRFVVRQIASGCLAVGNCTGATFVVQGLAQWRAALHAETDARQIPVGTTKLRVEWSEQPLFPRMIPVRRLPASAFPFGYGFQPSVEVVNPPANGSFYMPGEPLSVRVTFRDGAGKRLHPEGSLPSYGEFLRGEVASGLRYFDNFRINPTLYYALKHREGNLLVTLSGPSDRLKTPTRTVPVSDFFAPEITAAAVPDDGWSGTASGFPPFSILLGGLVDPSVWETPLSDTLTLTVPSDARPGTYVLAVKARRDFAGEALNRAATTNIQVGTATPTTFLATTGPCNTCHSGPSDTENVLHGVSDRRACYSCHASLETEPDAALDIRVHWVHDRSGRYRSVGGNIRNCAQCHLTPPDGPARGLLIP
jgi:hypothetical protein